MLTRIESADARISAEALAHAYHRWQLARAAYLCRSTSYFSRHDWAHAQLHLARMAEQLDTAQRETGCTLVTADQLLLSTV